MRADIVLLDFFFDEFPAGTQEILVNFHALGLVGHVVWFQTFQCYLLPLFAGILSLFALMKVYTPLSWRTSISVRASAFS